MGVLLRASMGALLLLCATIGGAEAKTLVFAGTSVKELTAPGDKWSDQMPAVLNDPGKGFRYGDSGDEVGVALLDAPIPASTKKLFDSNPGALIPAQIAVLSKSENPWIVRYCAERGKPYLARFSKKKFIVDEFIEEQRIQVSAPGGGAQCLSACKVESHAFALSKGKMVHIYWVRSVMRDAKTHPDAVLLKDLAKMFRAMLDSIRWE